MSNAILEKPRGLSAVDRTRLELLRQFITEQLSLSTHRAELAIGFLDVADDAGAIYAMRGMVAHVKAAIASANDLSAIKAGPAREDGH